MAKRFASIVCDQSRWLSKECFSQTTHRHGQVGLVLRLVRLRHARRSEDIRGIEDITRREGADDIHRIDPCGSFEFKKRSVSQSPQLRGFRACLGYSSGFNIDTVVR